MSGERKGTMDGVDFDKQEQQLHGRAEKFRAMTSKPGNKLGVINQRVDIYSDGTRMNGTIWRPETVKQGDKLPAILLCHGWGGKQDHLDFSYAPKFAQAGFVAVTFDYRGWGNSDGVLIAAEPQPKVGGKGEVVNIKARIVRKVIDPEWELRDVISAFNYMFSIPFVDTERIGIWGSSLGGGLALAAGAKDLRIKCIVAQIGSINTHANWINRHPDYKGKPAIEALAAEQAKGAVFPWTISMPIGLDGSPNLPKVVFEHTMNTIASLDKITAPTLLLAAENEELFKNEKNSDLVYDKLKGRVPVEIDYLPGGHYDAYNQPAYGIGLEKATEWFKIYLSNPGPVDAKL